MNRRVIGTIGIGGALALLLCLLALPMMLFGGSSLLFASGGGGGCVAGSNGTATQPGVSAEAANSIPANYLKWYQKVGIQYGVPWTILAGIGKVESDHGRSTLPGVTSGANAFGAAGPMQIGIEGAAGDQWATVATVEDGDPPASVYDPADAIAGAAKYLIAHGVQTNIQDAIFAYNHLDSYVEAVLGWSSTYAGGGYTVSAASPNAAAGATSASCIGTGTLDSLITPNAAVATAINFAQAQLGKPYLFGGTGPDAFDCSGLVMMAYRAAGINIPRTSEEQWAQLPHVAAANVEPGDLVFFAGADGTPTSPGHVGLVIGHDKMIEAYATGVPIRISTFGTPTSPPGLSQVVGFARPWAQPGLNLGGSANGLASAGAG